MLGAAIVVATLPACGTAQFDRFVFWSKVTHGLPKLEAFPANSTNLGLLQEPGDSFVRGVHAFDVGGDGPYA